MTRDERFKDLFAGLNDDGINAYEQLKPILEWNSSTETKALGAFLLDVRNQGAFHYIRNHFGDGLSQLKQSFGSVDDGFILEGTPQKGRIRFSFADTARNAAAFGATQDAKRLNRELENHLQEVLNVIGLLNHFLQSAFFTYCKTRGFVPAEDGNNFRIQPTRTNTS